MSSAQTSCPQYCSFLPLALLRISESNKGATSVSVYTSVSKHFTNFSQNQLFQTIYYFVGSHYQGAKYKFLQIQYLCHRSATAPGPSHNKLCCPLSLYGYLYGYLQPHLSTIILPPISTRAGIQSASKLVLRKVPSEDDPEVRNHGEGPYQGLLLVESGYYRFHI